MAFTDTIKTVVFAPKQQEASGFLPPMLRSMNHILYLLGHVADEEISVTTEQAQTELEAARVHWNARQTSPVISSPTRIASEVIGKALTEAVTEYKDWDDKTRLQNLRDLTNRMLAYSAHLDRELLGFRDSDPGSSL